MKKQYCARVDCPRRAKFVIWKTITRPPSLDLISEVICGYSLGKWAKNVLHKNAIKGEFIGGTRSFLRIQVKDFGFKTPVKPNLLFSDEFLKKWSEENLKGVVIYLSEPLDAFIVRLEYDEQAHEVELNLQAGMPTIDGAESPPSCDELKMAMTPLLDSRGYPRIFSLVRFGPRSLWINAHCAGPDCNLEPKEFLIFRFRTI